MSDTPPPVPIEALLAHSDWARSLARRLVGEGEADEVLQETWLAALRRPPQAGGDLRAWLGRVLGNAVRLRARRRSRSDAREREAARAEALPSATDLAARAESQGLLIEALLGLDEPLREVLLLRYYEGLSAAEIARRSGTPAGTVRWRLHTALAELRARLERRAGGSRADWCAALAPLLGPRPALVAVGTLSIPVLGGIVMKALILTSALAGVLWLALLGAGELPPAAQPDLVYAPLTIPAPEEADGERGASGPEPTRTALAADAGAALAAAATADSRAHFALRLVDGRGAPVEGARIAPDPSAGGEATSSDADGRAALALAPLAARSTYRLYFTRPGFANDVLRVAAQAGKRVDLGEITLREGGAASGVVVDGDGRPVAGIRVRASGAKRALPAGELRMIETTALGAAEARTDELGRFQLEGLLAGSVDLDAESDDRMWSARARGIEIRPSLETRGLRLVATELEAERRIEGIVLDPAGEPVAHAPIFARYRSLMQSSNSLAVADGEGRFRLRLTGPGAWDLTARDPRGRFAEVGAKAVRGGTRGLTLRFAPARHVELAVLTRDRETIPDWTADLYPTEADEPIAFAAPDLLRLPSGSFTLRVRAPGFDESELGPFDPAQLDGDRKLECILTPLPGVRGRVTRAGLAAAGVEVGLYALVSGRSTSGGFPLLFEPDATVSATSDGEGRFELTLRTRGRYVVRAQAQGLAPCELGPFELEPAVGLAGLNFELGAGGSITGFVRRSDGRPAVGRVVAASRGDGRIRSVRAGSDGSYSLETLTPGRWQVSLVDGEYSPGALEHSLHGGRPARAEIPWNCEVSEGVATHFDLDADPALGWLAGRLLCEGADPNGWNVELVPIDVAGPATVAQGQLDGEGRFGFELALPGGYLLDIESTRGLRFLDELEVDGGAIEWLHRIPCGRIELSGVPPFEAARANLLIWEGPGELRAWLPLLPDGAGSVSLDAFPAGRLRIVQRPEPLEHGPNHDEDPRAWPTLHQLELPAGGVLRERLP